MIHRRGVLPVLVLLLLVLLGFVVQIMRGPAAATPDGQSAASPTPTPATGTARAVLSSLAAVERAYDAGQVRKLCRPGVLVDPAVIRAQDARRHGCESELESLIANVPRLNVTVRDLGVRADLATAVVTANGSSATVDFVRRGGRWLLSFSDGDDPLPALAGTT